MSQECTLAAHSLHIREVGSIYYLFILILIWKKNPLRLTIYYPSLGALWVMLSFCACLRPCVPPLACCLSVRTCSVLTPCLVWLCTPCCFYFSLAFRVLFTCASYFWLHWLLITRVHSQEHRLLTHVKLDGLEITPAVMLRGLLSSLEWRNCFWNVAVKQHSCLFLFFFCRQG